VTVNPLVLTHHMAKKEGKRKHGHCQATSGPGITFMVAFS
jgi:hypothetical protein